MSGAVPLASSPVPIIGTVRKLVSAVLLLLLPLYLSSAAVASLCLPGVAFAAHAHGDQAPAQHSRAVDAHHHHAHDPQAGGHGHATAAHGGHHGAHAAAGAAAADDTGWPSDGSGCCHAAASALPTQHASAFSPPVLPGLVVPVQQPVASHLAEGLFRPPRAVLA